MRLPHCRKGGDCYRDTGFSRGHGRTHPSPLLWTPPVRKGPGGGHSQPLTKMLLDSVEDVHAVLAVNHVHCQAPLAKAARAPDPVQVGLVVRVPILVHGEVKVDDDRNLFDINTCMKGGEESGRETKTTANQARLTRTSFRWKDESGAGRPWDLGTGARSRTQREKQNLGRC